MTNINNNLDENNMNDIDLKKNLKDNFNKNNVKN